MGDTMANIHDLMDNPRKDALYYSTLLLGASNMRDQVTEISLLPMPNEEGAAFARNFPAAARLCIAAVDTYRTAMRLNQTAAAAKAKATFVECDNSVQDALRQLVNILP